MANLIQSILIFYCCLLSVRSHSRNPCSKPHCHWIKFLNDKDYDVNGEMSVLNDGRSFCHQGIGLLSIGGLKNLCSSVRVSITLTPVDGATIGRGNSSERALSGDETSTRRRNGTYSLELSPLGVDCVGIVPDESVQFQLVARKRLSYERLVLFGIGLTLFLAAPKLARSVTLFYGAGVGIGIIASLLILLYLFGKFVPKKTSIVGLGVLTGGYTLFASFFYWFWNNALEVVIGNWQYVAAYIVVAALISFAILYRMAPPTNERTLNLIQWTVQLVAMACIFLSFQSREVGVASILLILLLYNFTGWCWVVMGPLSLIHRALACLLWPIFAPCACLFSPICRCLSSLNPARWFRPRHRFLTQQEYEEQGRVETKKALEDLRKYCRKNNDGIWDRISNLNDSKRFASFLAGKSHVSAQEQVDYEWAEGSYDDSSSDESEKVSPRHDTSSHTPQSSYSRSGSTSRSSLSQSLNSSSDSPTFVRERERQRSYSRSPHHPTHQHHQNQRLHHISSSTPRSRTTTTHRH